MLALYTGPRVDNKKPLAVINNMQLRVWLINKKSVEHNRTCSRYGMQTLSPHELHK